MKYQITDFCFVFGKVIQKPTIHFSFLSYLLTGEKNILIDTVPGRSAEAFLADVDSVCHVEKLDALILNHSEEDHSGALHAVLSRNPNLPIYCTANCANRLLSDFPHANFKFVADRANVTIGGKTFQFIHTPGLHWDDNMVSYLVENGVLYSNDLFGQYLGEETPIDNQFSEEEVLDKVHAYFEKVFAVSSQKQRAVIRDIVALSPAMIAPGHGVILQRNKSAVESYYQKMCQ